MFDMKDLFGDVLSVNGVVGAVLLSTEGKVIYDSLGDNSARPTQTYKNWKSLLDQLKDTQEADFVMENGRFYLRRIEDNCIVISMQPFTSIAMVKLNCDILIPQLKNTKSNKGLRSFFKR